MRAVLVSLFLALPALAVLPVGERFAPAIVDKTVDDRIYPKASQYDEPKIMFGPHLVFPMEVHSRFPNEVLLYVKLNEDGYPTRIAVFRANQPVYERAAIANVMQTKWEISAKWSADGWFVHRVEFNGNEQSF